MTKLTASARRRIPKREFAGPNDSFPLSDAGHDRAAISGATRSEHAGNISPATASRIKSEARAKLKSSAPAKKKVPQRDGLAKYARETAKRFL